MIPLRLARELTYQLDKAKEHGRLARALAQIPVFLTLYQGEGVSDILTIWQQLAVKGREPEKYYRASLETLRKKASNLLPDALTTLHGLFNTRSNWDLSIELLTELLTWAKERKDEKRTMDTHRGLGVILRQRGNYDQSMTHLTESLHFAESLGDKGGMSRAVGSMGNVHYFQGGYVEAMACFERGYAIEESLGDKRGMATTIGNMGLVQKDQGRYAEAAACFERHLAMAESIGDKSGMLRAIGNMGNVHMRQGRYADAMVCFERNLAMAESLGDKSGMSHAISNMGSVHHEQDRYSEAIVCFERSLEMKEALGDKSGMSRAIGNMGEVHREQGRYTEAMVFYERQLAMAESLGDKQGMSNALGGMGLIHHVQGCYAEALHSYRSAFEVHREIGFQKGMTYWLEGIARTLLKLVEGGDSSRRDVLRTSQPTPENSTMTGDMRSTSLREARENAEECVRISQEIGKPDTLFSGRVLLARIDAAEGNVAQAAEKLEAMLAEATDEEQIADLYYWLWKIDPGLSFPRTRESRPQDSDWPDLDSRVRGNDIEGTHRSEALRLYESLYSRIPKFEFVKRIAELKGEHVPMSADDLETS